MAQPPSRKRIAARVGKALLLGLSILTAAAAAGVLALPLVLEGVLQGRLDAVSGIDRISLKVRRVGPFGIDLGPLSVGGPRGRSIEADAVRIDFTPSGLFHGRVKQVTVDGLELRIALRNGSVAMPGIDFATLAGGAGDGTADASGRGAPPALPVGLLVVRHAVLEIQDGRRRHTVPFSLTVAPGRAGAGDWIFDAGLRPLGQEVSASGSFDPTEGFGRLRFHSRRLSIGCLSPWAESLLPGVLLRGRTDVFGSAVIDLRPVSLQSFSVVALASEVAAVRGPWRLRAGDDGHPLRIELQQEPGRTGSLYASRLVLETPATTVALENLIVPFSTAGTDTEGSGTALLRLDSLPPRGTAALSLEEKARLPLRFRARHAGPGHWQFDLVSEPGPAAALALTAGGRRVGFDLEKVSVSAHGQDGALSATVSASTGDFHATLPGASLQARRAALVGGFDRAGGADAGRSWADFTFRLIRPRFEAPAAGLSAEHVTISGEVDGLRPEDRSRLHAKVSLEGGSASAAGNRLTASGIRLSLPVHWPLEGKGRPGRITVAKVQSRSEDMGPIDLRLHQEGGRLRFAGSHESRLLPGLRIGLEGSAGRAPDGSWNGELQAGTGSDPYALDIDLGRFVPSAAGYRVSGDLAAFGRVTFDAEGAGGSVDARLDSGSLRAEAAGLEVQGIRTSLRFSDLPDLRTDPQQELRFDSARVGSLRFADGSAVFQLESPDALFLERASFHWCGGSVDAHAVRLSPSVEDVRAVLYCDRLVLSQILEQFGTVRAEGEGTVNGKIPLRLHDGSVTFSDGFLYSTPGRGGTIRLTGTEILTAGVPQSAPQYSHLDLASEALKDYSYDWARLGMNSEGETLILRLQMDGKPAQPLPFAYRKEIGGFVRVEAGSEGSEFQGIRLDVNFKLPLDKILRYQDLFKGLP